LPKGRRKENEEEKRDERDGLPPPPVAVVVNLWGERKWLLRGFALRLMNKKNRKEIWRRRMVAMGNQNK
jgi:hypothetical protein